MKKKKQPTLSSTDKELLAELSAKPEFAAFRRLLSIEMNNIAISNWKTPSSSPNLAMRKSFDEGRVFEIKEIIKMFDKVRKEKD